MLCKLIRHVLSSPLLLLLTYHIAVATYVHNSLSFGQHAPFSFNPTTRGLPKGVGVCVCVCGEKGVAIMHMRKGCLHRIWTAYMVYMCPVCHAYQTMRCLRVSSRPVRNPCVRHCQLPWTPSSPLGHGTLIALLFSNFY